MAENDDKLSKCADAQKQVDELVAQRDKIGTSSLVALFGGGAVSAVGALTADPLVVAVGLGLGAVGAAGLHEWDKIEAQIDTTSHEANSLCYGTPPRSKPERTR